MKRFYLITMPTCFCSIGAMAQTPTATPGPATTAGPVCRVTLTGPLMRRGGYIGKLDSRVSCPNGSKSYCSGFGVFCSSR